MSLLHDSHFGDKARQNEGINYRPFSKQKPKKPFYFLRVGQNPGRGPILGNFRHTSGLFS
jgi:hypothetical protein